MVANMVEKMAMTMAEMTVAMKDAWSVEQRAYLMDTTKVE